MNPLGYGSVTVAHYRPGGVREELFIDRPDSVVRLAEAVNEAGGFFTIETLTTNDISIACEAGDGDIAGVILEGKPGADALNSALDEVVHKAFERLVSDPPPPVRLNPHRPPPPPVKTARENLLPDFGGWQRSKGFSDAP